MDHDIRTPLKPDLEQFDLLDTLSDAVIFLDTKASILAANERAGAIIGTDKYDLPGHTIWQAAPHLVSTTFYQAVINAIRTRASLQIEYRSPITQTWFKVHLLPTSEGIVLFINEEKKPTTRQHLISQRREGYLDLLENISEWVGILNPEGLLLEINQQSLTDAQVLREDVIGTPFPQLPPWASAPVAQEQLWAAIKQASQGATVSFEAKLCLQAGPLQDVAWTLTPQRDGNQQVEYIISTGRDITENKHAEEELWTLVEAIPQFIWIAEPNGAITYNNQLMCNYLAMTLEQVRGDGWTVHVHPDDLQRVWDAWQTAIQTSLPLEVEYRMRDGNNGTYRWFLVRGVPQRNAQGTIQSWIGTCTDVDEQKQAEEKIKASEQNFRVLAETVPHQVWTLQADGRVDYANQRYLQYRNLAQADLKHLENSTVRQAIHPEDSVRVALLRKHALETGEPYENEYRIKNGQTGEYHWLLTRAHPVRDDMGQINKWFVTGTNIDEQKRTEEALRQSQAQVQALMASNIIGIVVANGEEIIEANDTFLHMVGYSREDLQQGRLNWMSMTAPEYVTVSRQAHAQLVQHQDMTPYEKEYVCKDGSRLAVLVGGVATHMDSQQSSCFILDNSARKALEQRKDTFISMAGHELRTPLTSLKMQMQLLRRRLEKQGQQQIVTTFAKVEEPIRQLERLISELLDVSKMQAGKLEYIQETVDLGSLVQEVALTMQQIQIHTTHTIIVQNAGPLMVVGDKDRLEQVIINLLSNAIKYSPNAKEVEIALHTTAETATITVRDYGAGIPQEQREKIFERFYRVSDPQKGVVSGLGMGLYIVEEIVKQHQGTIVVESALGKGSTFHVTLPLKRGA